MKEIRLTKQQQIYLVSELKDVVDNYDAYNLDTPNDYDAVLSILTEMFNDDWRTHYSESIIDHFLASYFANYLTK